MNEVWKEYKNKNTKTEIQKQKYKNRNTKTWKDRGIEYYERNQFVYCNES